MTRVNTIIFDLGGVLIDWNPEYVFRTLFEDEKEMHYFLKNVCHMDWNIQQDKGRSLADATAERIGKFPEYESPIKAYYGRWEEMLGGPIHGTVKLLDQLYREKNYRLLALTNWSAETFPVAQSRYGFLDWFEYTLVSGKEGMIKPDAEIYEKLLADANVVAESSLFIDDSAKNIQGARAVGLQALQFVNSGILELQLKGMKIL